MSLTGKIKEIEVLVLHVDLQILLKLIYLSIGYIRNKFSQRQNRELLHTKLLWFTQLLLNQL